MAEDDSREDDSGDTSLDELWWSMNISDEYGSNDTNYGWDAPAFLRFLVILLLLRNLVDEVSFVFAKLKLLEFCCLSLF